MESIIIFFVVPKKSAARQASQSPPLTEQLAGKQGEGGTEDRARASDRAGHPAIFLRIEGSAGSVCGGGRVKAGGSVNCLACFNCFHPIYQNSRRNGHHGHHFVH